MLLASNNLWVASPAIIDRLRADPNYAGRDDDLLDNGGTETPRGYVEATGVTLAAGGTLFVQNTRRDRGKLGRGHRLRRHHGRRRRPHHPPTGAAPAMVTAFGRRLNADGSFTTGDGFFFEVEFPDHGGRWPRATPWPPSSTPASSSPASARAGCRRAPARAAPIRSPARPAARTAILLPPGAEGDDLIDTSFAAEGLIEEPVTSGGESEPVVARLRPRR